MADYSDHNARTQCEGQTGQKKLSSEGDMPGDRLPPIARKH